jgi:hypothetical protein
VLVHFRLSVYSSSSVISLYTFLPFAHAYADYIHFLCVPWSLEFRILHILLLAVHFSIIFLCIHTSLYIIIDRGPRSICVGTIITIITGILFYYNT